MEHQFTSSPTPTPSPSLSFNLPPQSVPLLTLVPTLNSDQTKNDAIKFRVTALAVLFSLSGIIFFLILTHHSILFLLNKKWDHDDVSKWELQNQNEERHLLLEEIENGNKKPECGIQWDDNYLEDQEVRLLEPSWVREKDFSMQWENIDETICKYPNKLKVLTPNPNRWSSVAPSHNRNQPSPRKGFGNGQGKVVTKREKKIQPEINSSLSLEPGMVVNVQNPFGPIRPGRIISVHGDKADLCRVEYTDDEGGIDENVPKETITLQYMAQFHFEVHK